MSATRTLAGRSIVAGLLALAFALALAGVAQAATFTVDKTGDVATGNATRCQPGHATGTCSVRDAVVALNATTGGSGVPSDNTINIPAGNYLLNTDQSLIVRQPVTIVGAGARSTILDGDGSARIFEFRPLAPSVVSGVTLTDGLAGPRGGVQPGFGGAVLTQTSLTLNTVAVTDSFAASGGGGIAVAQQASFNALRASGFVQSASLTVTDSTIGGDPSLIAFDGPADIRAGNSAYGSGQQGDAGGGIYAASFTTVSLTNTTVVGNIAGNGDDNFPPTGGGIFVGSSAQLRTLNATIADNQVTTNGAGGGVGGPVPPAAARRTARHLKRAQLSAGSFFAQNTIVARNTTTGRTNCANVSTTSQNDNLSDDSSCGFGAANDIQGADPKLDAKATNNGGPTDTVALLAGSPALDSARDTGCPNASQGTNIDQRGITRPQGPACDIGAYELIVAPAIPPAPSADLQVVKTASTPFPAVGQNITYTLAVRNNGPSQATGVTVTDTVPAGETLVSSASLQGPCSGNPSLTCAVGTLAVGQTAIVTVVVRAAVTGTVTNGARVVGAEPDPNPANNSSQATISVVATPASERSPRVTVAGVPGCVSRGAALRIRIVTGSGVRRVRVLVNGKVAMLTTRSTFVLNLSSRTLSASRNVVAVRVTSRGGRSTTKSTVLRHCQVIAPRFTG